MKIKRFQEPSGTLDYAQIYRQANPDSAPVPAPRIDQLYDAGYTDNLLNIMYQPQRYNPHGSAIVSQDLVKKYEQSPFSGVEKTVGTALMAADLGRGFYRLVTEPAKLALSTSTMRVPTKEQLALAKEFRDVTRGSYSLSQSSPDYQKFKPIIAEMPTLRKQFGKNIPLEEMALASHPVERFNVPQDVLDFYDQDVLPRQERYRGVLNKRNVPNQAWNQAEIGYTPPNYAGWHDTDTKVTRISNMATEPDVVASHEFRHALQDAYGNRNMSNSSKWNLLKAYSFPVDSKTGESLGPLPQLLERQATNTELRYRLWKKYRWKDIDEGNQIISDLDDAELVRTLGETNAYGQDFVRYADTDMDRQIEAVKILLKDPNADVSGIMEQKLAQRIAKQAALLNENYANRYINQEVGNWVLKQMSSRIKQALQQTPVRATGASIPIPYVVNNKRQEFSSQDS